MKLTNSEIKILESYKTIIFSLSSFLGEGYEIVLHSFEDLNKSIICICNGKLSARKVGGTLTELEIQILKKLNSDKKSKNYMTYFNRNSKGEPTKSLLSLIRGDEHKIIGILCINFYLNTPFTRIMSAFLPQKNLSQHAKIIENFENSTDELILAAVNKAKADVDADATINSKDHNKQIILKLKENGIFSMKKAIPTVAKQLKISKNTIYLHLRNSEKN